MIASWHHRYRHLRWGLVVLSSYALLPRPADARQPRRIRQGLAKLGAKSSAFAASAVANVFELPPRGRKFVAASAATVGSIHQNLKQEFKGDSAFPKVSFVGRAIENGDMNAAKDGIGRLERDLQQKLRKGKFFAILLAALQLFLAERKLRHAAEDAVGSDGSTSMKAMEVLADERAHPRDRGRYRTNSLQVLQTYSQERAADAVARQSPLELYVSIVRERRSGMRFDPWHRGRGHPALELIRRFHLASIRNGLRCMDGFKLPFGRRVASTAEALSNKGYSKMLEIADQLVDVMLLDLDPNYKGADPERRKERAKRLHRGNVEEIVRLAEHAHDVMTQLHINTTEDGGLRGREQRDRLRVVGLRLADIGELLLDRLMEMRAEGRVRLTEADMRRLRQARRKFAMARRREYRPMLASPLAVGHNAFALLTRLQDRLKEAARNEGNELWADFMQHVLELGGGARAKVAHGRQQAQVRLQGVVTAGP